MSDDFPELDRLGLMPHVRAHWGELASASTPRHEEFRAWVREIIRTEARLPAVILRPEARRAPKPKQLSPEESERLRAAECCEFRDELGFGCCARTTCRSGGRRAGQVVRISDCLDCVDSFRGA
jgi:hypothetical protein